MQSKATNEFPSPDAGEPQPFEAIQWQPGLSRRQLAVSVGLHLLGLLVIGVIAAFTLPIISDPENIVEITLLTDEQIDEAVLIPEPEPAPVVPKPVPEPEPEPAPAPPPTVEVIPPVEIVEAPKPKPPEPRHEVVKTEFDDVKPAAPEPPKREVQTDLFAGSRSAEPSLDAPARAVQTGGFGDPEGIVGTDPARKPGARAQLGAFDLPAGPGQGNGAAGARGRRGTVAGAGFGDQAATTTASSKTTAREAVRPAGFADRTAAEAPVRSKPRVVESTTLPVEIVSKPNPSYTDEARRKHLEGEVVLEVLFRASGRTQVLRVVSGLGSGLDESAVRAAEQIVFKPARRDGQPVDYTTVVRILFQLA